MKKITDKISINSPVILAFVFICLIQVIINRISHGDFTRDLAVGGSFTNFGTYVRLLLYPFAHLNFNHFFGNMMLMLIIGPTVEEKYGSKKLLNMIFITTIIIGLCQILFFSTYACGASGLIFMLILLNSFINTEEDKIPLTVILVAVLYLGQEIYTGIANHDSVSQFGHIAGGVMGLIFGFNINKKTPS